MSAADGTRGTPTDVRLANEAWESLLGAHKMLLGAFATEDVWSPITMREYDVLYTLRKGPAEGMRLRDLNASVLLSQPSLSRLVDRMVGAGLVTRRPAPQDGRGVLVQATPAGQAAQREVGRKHSRSVAAHLGANLTTAELHRLRELCAAITPAEPDRTRPVRGA